MSAAIDPQVLDGRMTEIWASVTVPIGADRMPLVVFLHGNHGTCGQGQNPRKDSSCEYTSSGTCPAGFEVTPNHLGYQYLADQLAARGAMVVSINANRGITCGRSALGDSGLILARGRLVLKHLQLLSEWNQHGGAPATIGVDLTAKIDFSRVGLMGHSRGGEGMRAAYNLLNDAGSEWRARLDPSTRIRGVYEIAPVDGQSDRVLDANNVPWSVLLPMCDGDVSSLEGMWPLDRMMTSLSETQGSPKSSFNVWGANHNFFNTEWQLSDADSCTNHEPLWTAPEGADVQRKFSSETLVPFFLSHLQLAEQALVHVFDSLFALPGILSELSRVERGFTPSVRREDVLALRSFTSVTPATQPPAGDLASQVAVNIGWAYEHESALKRAMVSWDHAGANVFYQVGFESSDPDGVNLADQAIFEFRIARPSATREYREPLVFSIQLVGQAGVLSKAVVSSDWIMLASPADHELLFSARIPVSVFEGIDLHHVNAVRFIFDQTAQGKISVAQFRAVQGSVPAQPPFAQRVAEPQGVEPPPQQSMFSVRRGRAVIRRNGVGPLVEIELSAVGGFEVQDRLPVLQIGTERYRLSHYPESGETDRIIFTIPESNLLRHADHEPVVLNPGHGPDRARVVFGRLGEISTQ